MLLFFLISLCFCRVTHAGLRNLTSLHRMSVLKVIRIWQTSVCIIKIVLSFPANNNCFLMYFVVSFSRVIFWVLRVQSLNFSFFSGPLWSSFWTIFELNCCSWTVVCESNKHRLSIPLVEHWRGRSKSTEERQRARDYWLLSCVWIHVHRKKCFFLSAVSPNCPNNTYSWWENSFLKRKYFFA